MNKKVEDEEAAHRYFSVECFNRAWDLIDKPEDKQQLLDDLVTLGEE